jgi:hypothetical protein
MSSCRLNIVTSQRIAWQRLDKHPAMRARNTRTNDYSLLLGKVSASMDWRDNYHMICFLCGLRYARVELCFLRCPCLGYITRVCLQLWRIQEGSAVESTRRRMERVLSEL